MGGGRGSCKSVRETRRVTRAVNTVEIHCVYAYENVITNPLSPITAVC